MTIKYGGGPYKLCSNDPSLIMILENLILRTIFFMTRFHVNALGTYGPLAGYKQKTCNNFDKLNIGFKCHVTLLA